MVPPSSALFKTMVSVCWRIRRGEANCWNFWLRSADPLRSRLGMGFGLKMVNACRCASGTSAGCGKRRCRPGARTCFASHRWARNPKCSGYCSAEPAAHPRAGRSTVPTSRRQQRSAGRQCTCPGSSLQCRCDNHNDKRSTRTRFNRWFRLYAQAAFP